MCRDTMFMILVHPEMYRDTVFIISVYPDMYHDTVFVGGVFPPVCVGAPDKHVVSRSFLSRFTVVKGPMDKQVN